MSRRSRGKREAFSERVRQPLLEETVRGQDRGPSSFLEEPRRDDEASSEVVPEAAEEEDAQTLPQQITVFIKTKSRVLSRFVSVPV